MNTNIKFSIIFGLLAVFKSNTAVAVTELDIRQARPLGAVLGRALACNNRDKEKFFSFYADSYRAAFQANKKLKESVYKHDCGNFPAVPEKELLRIVQGLKIFVKKTDKKTFQSMQPIFKLCTNKTNIEDCTKNGAWDFPVVLEKGSVKFVTD
jgi:DNA-binding helix-hairpin-helix protein with protein kinase domain